MLRAIGVRLLRLFPVLFVVSLGAFFVLELVPGDPAAAVLGEAVTEEELEAVRIELGLDQPIHERYVDWLGDAVTGDLGKSLIGVTRGQSVTTLLRQGMSITAQIALMAMLIALIVAIPIAIYAAYRDGQWFDRLSGNLAAVIISIPPFLTALLLIFFFVFNRSIPRYLFLAAGLGLAAAFLWTAGRRMRDPVSAREPLLYMGLGVVTAAIAVLVTNKFPAFPRIGFERLTGDEGLAENLRHSILPAVALAATEVAVFMRLLRTDLIATLQEDFVLSAKAKGMPTWRVLTRDALRPSSFSLITLAGVTMGRLIGGTVIIETIFGIQGVGQIVVGSIIQKNFPIVQGGVLVIATAYVVLNMLVDLSYVYLDPRVRRGRQ